MLSPTSRNEGPTFVEGVPYLPPSSAWLTWGIECMNASYKTNECNGCSVLTIWKHWIRCQVYVLCNGPCIDPLAWESFFREESVCVAGCTDLKLTLLYHVAVWLWASYLPCLCFSFLICYLGLWWYLFNRITMRGWISQGMESSGHVVIPQWMVVSPVTIFMFSAWRVAQW